MPSFFAWVGASMGVALLALVAWWFVIDRRSGGGQS
jgi:hypothetical protein